MKSLSKSLIVILAVHLCLSNCTPTPSPSSDTSGGDHTPDTSQSRERTSSRDERTQTRTNTNTSQAGSNIQYTLAPELYEQLQEKARATKESAAETAQAAQSLINYFINTGVEPSSNPPCFSGESQYNQPGVDYLQKLLEDYHSLNGYGTYLHLVDQSTNYSLNVSGANYWIRFVDLENTFNHLRTDLKTLIKIVLGREPALDREEDGSGGGQQRVLEEYCYDTSYSRQYRTYASLGILVWFDIYLQDVDGLLEIVTSGSEN